jgi:hypothetical protein
VRHCVHALQLNQSPPIGVVGLFHLSIIECIWRSSQELCNRKAKKLPPATLARQRATTRIDIKGILDLQLTCAECRFGIDIGSRYHHCFADQCLKSWNACEDCFARYGHQHATFTETYRLQTRGLRGEHFRETLTNVFRRFAARPIVGWRIQRQPTPTTAPPPASQEQLDESCSALSVLMHASTELQPTITHDGQCAWITYGQMLRLSSSFGNALGHLVDSRQLIGICSENRFEFFICDVACMRRDIIAVPLFTTLEPRTMSIILDDARLCGVVVSNKRNLLTVAEASLLCKYQTLQFVVLMDAVDCEHNDADRLFVSEFATRFPMLLLYSFAQLLLAGERLFAGIDATDDSSSPVCVLPIVGDAANLNRPRELADDDVFIIEYTSGSTGTPKGVVISNQSWNNPIANSQFNANIMIAYQPLAHSSHANCYTHFSTGGCIFLYPHDFGNAIFEDMYETDAEMERESERAREREIAIAIAIARPKLRV